MRLPTATQADNARAAALSAFDCADTTFIEAAFHRSRRVLCAFTARNQVRDDRGKWRVVQGWRASSVYVVQFWHSSQLS